MGIRLKQMKIFLHNPSHNGDILHTLGLVKIFIESNPDYEFVLVPSCSSFLYSNLLSSNVILMQHPRAWTVQMTNVDTEYQNIISNLHHVTCNVYNDNLYINLWKILTDKNPNCISLKNRLEYCREIIKQINEQLGTYLKFNCDSYTELIPQLPKVDVSDVTTKLHNLNKPLVLFYNLNSFSGFEYTKKTNDEIIDYLLKKYNQDEYALILVKPNSKYNDLLTLERDFNIIPSADGKNLIIAAHIANECNHVYFKTNGGSQFILNKSNIQNNNNVVYHFMGDDDFYKVISDEYELNCIHENM
jgi:hypothetical protein